MDTLLQVEQQVLGAARIGGGLAVTWLVVLALVACRHRRSPDRALVAMRRLGAPSLVCRALLLVLCVGVTQPAYADAPQAAVTPENALAWALDGLPSPALPAPDAPVRAAVDRAEERRAAPAPAACTHRVRPGESLWSITEELSGVERRLADLDRGWRGLYDDNRAVIGDDPDLLTVDARLDISFLAPGCDRS